MGWLYSFPLLWFSVTSFSLPLSEVDGYLPRSRGKFLRGGFNNRISSTTHDPFIYVLFQFGTKCTTIPLFDRKERKQDKIRMKVQDEVETC